MRIRQPEQRAMWTCHDVVAMLDRYIIGQGEAKKAVAIALRNRWRRMQLPLEMRREVVPNNIILIGPTGVGKTEIARRLSQLADLPFLKVEATKFTEKGYVGRDVDSMVRDLVENGVALLRRRKEERFAAEIAATRVTLRRSALAALARVHRAGTQIPAAYGSVTGTADLLFVDEQPLSTSHPATSSSNVVWIRCDDTVVPYANA